MALVSLGEFYGPIIGMILAKLLNLNHASLEKKYPNALSVISLWAIINHEYFDKYTLKELNEVVPQILSCT